MIFVDKQNTCEQPILLQSFQQILKKKLKFRLYSDVMNDELILLWNGSASIVIVGDCKFFCSSGHCGILQTTVNYSNRCLLQLPESLHLMGRADFFLIWQSYREQCTEP